MSKTKPHIPQTEAELTADWYSKNLGLGKVSSVHHEVVGEGIGFMGTLYRAHLNYDDAADKPPSVITKLPTLIEANRSVGEGLMAYEREIRVYKDMEGDLGIVMPKHYHSDLDPDPAPFMEKVVLFLFEKLPVKAVGWIIQQFLKIAGKSKRRYLLVMEDIADARPPTQVTGGSLDDALSALEVLAQFHAHNWQRASILDEQPKIFPMDRVPKIWQANYIRYRDDFVKQFGHVLDADALARVDHVQENFSDYINVTVEPPCTVLHGDYRLDNVLFRPSGEPVVLDYQLMSWGRAGWDVGYFITTALTPDHRHEEEQMLRHYHQALEAAGVTDYSYKNLTDDVQLCKLLLAHRMVGSGGDELETEIKGQDESFLDVLATRVFGWIDVSWRLTNR